MKIWCAENTTIRLTRHKFRWSISEIKDVLNLAGHELDSDEVLFVFVARVEEEKAIWLHGFEMKVDVQLTRGRQGWRERGQRGGEDSGRGQTGGETNILYFVLQFHDFIFCFFFANIRCSLLMRFQLSKISYDRIDSVRSY